jgi:hypothetical protein
VLSRQHPVSGTRPSIVGALILAAAAAAASDGPPFDHAYEAYARVLAPTVAGDRIDYRLLVSRKHDLDSVAAGFGAPPADVERGWARRERMAFWINAYNVFTLKAVADRYPIRAPIFTLQPRNSIRQIEGVWTDLRFTAASRQVTLDDIEHRILRPEFKDARVHFAINCASVSCPPLREEPYVASRLDAQLDEAARRYLASPLGLRVNGRTLSVSSIFKWYGDDFIMEFAGRVNADVPPKERAILGTVATYGPPAAREVATAPGPRIRFLPYDWELNDRRP